jgi:hypothetical protein
MSVITVILARHELRSMVAEHAEMLGRAEEHRRTADRLDRLHELERAECERDDEREILFRANCLAKLLEAHGVSVPDPRQLSLLSLGDAA